MGKKNRERSGPYSFIQKARKSVWTFPVVITFILLGLTVFKIHGSSIGIYHQVLYGSEIEDPNLLYGSPKSIRSDEWLGWTQYIVRQDKIGYPVFDSTRGTGRDATKNPETPVKDWPNIFRPQNLSFFILPFEYAFAFKWWISAYILVLSCYFFVLRIFPKKYLLGALLSISFTISPFLLWWYQSGLFLTMAYGFLVIIIGLRILNQEKIPRIQSKKVANLFYVLALSYIGVSTALFFYPPYAIPIMLGAVSYLIGHLLHKLLKEKVPWQKLARRSLLFVCAAVIAAIIGFVFLAQHQEMIKGTANTKYPGSRKSVGGDLPVRSVLDGFLMPLLQREPSGKQYYTNQSEASSFILLLPFLLLPGILIQVWEYRKYRRIDWVLFSLNACALLFFARAFIPYGNQFYNLLLLDRVPTVRMRAGMGFLGFIHLLILVKKIGETKLQRSRHILLAAGYGIMCLAILLWVGHQTIQAYPLFLNNYSLMIFFAVLFSTIITAFLANFRYIGAALFLIFSVGSSFKILPLYQGLEFARNSEIIRQIDTVSSPGDSWITTDDIYFINLPAMAGEGLLSGSQSYPDLDFWEQIAGSKYEKVYNRQARSYYISNNPDMEPLELIQPNLFVVKLECTDFLLENVDYVLAVSHLQQPCVSLVDTVTYPKKTFYIYRVVP